MGFGERLKELREQKGFSQKEFAQKVNVSPSAISQFESGRNFPKSTVLVNILNILECDANYLFQDYFTLKKNIECTKEEYEIIEHYRRLNDSEKSIVLAVINLAYEARGRRDNSANINGVKKKLYIPVIKNHRYTIENTSKTIYIKSSALSIQADYCFKIVDESMAPFYRQNDVLLIKKVKVKHNETGLFQINGYLLAAKFFIHEGKPKLVPLDKSLKPITITPKMHFKTLGKVLGKIKGEY